MFGKYHFTEQKFLSNVCELEEYKTNLSGRKPDRQKLLLSLRYTRSIDAGGLERVSDSSDTNEL